MTDARYIRTYFSLARALLAYELHHDLAVPAVVQLDQEDPLPLADDEPAVRYRHGLTGAQQQVLAV